MVAFSRKGRKGRREEVEKLPCPSVSAEGSFRVFSGKTAKWNPSWERRSAEGRRKAPPRRRCEGAALQSAAFQPVVGLSFVLGERVSAAVIVPC